MFQIVASGFNANAAAGTSLTVVLSGVQLGDSILGLTVTSSAPSFINFRDTVDTGYITSQSAGDGRIWFKTGSTAEGTVTYTLETGAAVTNRAMIVYVLRPAQGRALPNPLDATALAGLAADSGATAGFVTGSELSSINKNLQRFAVFGAFTQGNAGAVVFSNERYGGLSLDNVIDAGTVGTGFIRGGLVFLEGPVTGQLSMNVSVAPTNSWAMIGLTIMGISPSYGLDKLNLERMAGEESPGLDADLDSRGWF